MQRVKGLGLYKCSFLPEVSVAYCTATPQMEHSFSFLKSICQPICKFCHVYICASIQLEIHSPGNTNKITNMHPILYSKFYRYFI